MIGVKSSLGRTQIFAMMAMLTARASVGQMCDRGIRGCQLSFKECYVECRVRRRIIRVTEIRPQGASVGPRLCVRSDRHPYA